jgi:hypothetical protein
MSSINFNIKIGNNTSDVKGLATFKIDAEMHKDKVIALIRYFRSRHSTNKCNTNYQENNFLMFSLSYLRILLRNISQ